MSYWDPFDLAALPLSAYTPGQGDPKMEGGWQTASGKPVYTYEMFVRGEAPYVTGATNRLNPSGQLVYRTMGDQQVPVRITDYGPKVKGIDIATSNKDWATQFPYQGSRDIFNPPQQTGRIGQLMAQNDRGQLLKDIDNTFYGGGQAPTPAPTPTPTPTSTPVVGGRPGPIDQGVLAQFAVRNYAQPVAGVGDSGQFAAYNQPGSTIPATAGAGAGAAQSGAGAIAGILGAFGKSMQQGSQQGMQQALAMLQRQPAAAGLLAQFANNPTAFLRQINLEPIGPIS